MGDQFNKTRQSMARFLCLAFLASISTAWAYHPNLADFLLENKELDLTQIPKFIKETELIIRNDKHFDFKGFLARFDNLVQQQITDRKIDEDEETIRSDRHRRQASTTLVTTTDSGTTSFESAYSACLKSCTGTSASCQTSCAAIEFTNCVNQCVNQGSQTKDQCTSSAQCVAVTSTVTATTPTNSNSTITTESPNNHEGLEILLLLLLVYEIFSHGSSDLDPTSGSGNLMLDLGLLMLITFLARKLM